MISVVEQEQDVIAERQFAEREQDLDRSRRQIASRVRKLNERARNLRYRLAELDPGSEAAAELTSKLEDLAQDVETCRLSLYLLVADALATVDEDGDLSYNYTASDVKSWCDRAVDMGCSRPRLNAALVKDLARMREVPNAPFRERLNWALAVEGRNIEEITLAARAELSRLEERDGAEYGAKNLAIEKRGRTKAQHRQVERLLGVVGRPAGDGLSLKLFITYELGLAFMRALGMTPQQAGL